MSTGEFDDAVALLVGAGPLRESCRYIVAVPGKRFRASVLSEAARYGPEPDGPLVQRAAAAIELFHAATLAHDDVVDDGQLRRGQPTIGVHSGNLAASLAGGWLFARASELVAGVGEEEATRFAETAATVCEGEMLELGDLHDVERSRERYLAVIEAKTASLIALSAWLGARAGGAAPDVAERLYRYGEAVGMAFQISDDILDLVGDPQKTGKTPGSDLRQGVYTLPVIYALEADPALREALLRGPEQDELPQLVERVLAGGGLEAALADCEGWVGEARASLPDPEPRVESEAHLATLAGSMMKRMVGVAPA